MYPPSLYFQNFERKSKTLKYGSPCKCIRIYQFGSFNLIIGSINAELNSGYSGKILFKSWYRETIFGRCLFFILEPLKIKKNLKLDTKHRYGLKLCEYAYHGPKRSCSAIDITSVCEDRFRKYWNAKIVVPIMWNYVCICMWPGRG